jgi:hypothetical protein
MRPPSPDNAGRHFPGPRIDPNTPGEPYQVNETKNEPEENLANVTMETYAQDAPSSCMSRHHVVSNTPGRDVVAIPPGGD